VFDKDAFSGDLSIHNLLLFSQFSITKFFLRYLAICMELVDALVTTVGLDGFVSANPIANTVGIQLEIVTASRGVRSIKDFLCPGIDG
jgi:hypothetical protein